VSYSMDGADYIASGEWDRLLDDIYLGVLLLDFYVEREMTVLQIDDQAAHLHFAGGVATVVKRDGSSLLVTEGDVVIARNFDRFIPRGESIYAYSRDGSDGRWTLPAPFRNKPLEVRTLGAADVPKITQAAPSGSIDLELKARTPVKITVAPGSPG